MQLIAPKHQLVASLLLAGLGLILFFAGELYALGYALRIGFVGPWLFVIGVWFFVDAVYSVPASEHEQMLPPGEWQAWIELAFICAILWQLHQGLPSYLPHVPIHLNPDAGLAGRSLVPTFIAWAILAGVLHQRSGQAIAFDERDREIEKQASSWAYGTTMTGVIAIALLLGFSPVDRLMQFSPAWLAQVLIMVLVAGRATQCAAMAGLYWRQRRELS